MKLEQVRKVGVLGGGVMGGGIAQVVALAGYEVLVRDINDEVIDATRETVFDGKWGIKRGVERGKIPFDEALSAMQRIAFTMKLEDLADVDVLIEAIPEKLELKQEVFKDLDRMMKPEAIFATNTSGFCIQDVARDVSEARKRQFVGMHFSNPVVSMRMCEVIHTPESSEETIETVKGLAEASGKVVSMVKDMPGTYGFILNRVFGAARREAMAIVEAGIATKEDVDKAMITGRNWPAGFFGSRGGIGKEW
ncbi:MAG TPA: 3-hydroxyacyl-CoA dehydrogenase family protein [Tepidiformaceae bacterium]|nr:3-hydroxyacyl-CoA dehydrogenase family protein [Tepidiformaceae bacterium]